MPFMLRGWTSPGALVVCLGLMASSVPLGLGGCSWNDDPDPGDQGTGGSAGMDPGAAGQGGMDPGTAGQGGATAGAAGQGGAAPVVGPIHDLSDVPRPAVTAKSPVLTGFMRGINLGNALDAPEEGDWGVTLQEAHFEMVKDAGLDHVRLPVRFSAHAEAEAPYTIDEAFFERVDWAVEQATSRGLSIIVDVHHYQEMMEEPEAHTPRFLGLWSQIAERYKDQPASVAFELLNEPHSELTADLLNDVTAQAIALVRETNPTRLIIADCYFWANADHLSSLVLPAEDPNLAATFHMYQPILFTHQGAEWNGPEFGTSGLVFPAPPAQPLTPVPAAEAVSWIRNWIDAYNEQPLLENPGGPAVVFEHFAYVEDYIERTGIPVYLGEFGVIDRADPKSRENYVRLIREEAERRDIGWAYWDDGGSFEAMRLEEGDWVPYLKSALLD